jgi:hypothetical protein
MELPARVAVSDVLEKEGKNPGIRSGGGIRALWLRPTFVFP